MALRAGSRLGPYEIVGSLGAGGMGEVYRARDTRLDRIVAIKVLPAELGADPERRTRFEREARAVAALSHPHICSLFDIGEAVAGEPDSVAAGQRNGRAPSPESRAPSSGPAPSSRPPVPSHYLVMEYLAGESLADRLLRGPVGLAQALDVGAQIAEALDAAHKHGIIHRDLKPGNVMLTPGGSGRSGVTVAKLLDFGLAKLAAHGEQPALAAGASAPTAAAPVTAEGTILGTLQYMAPEQLEGKEADARTDLWALGAILYEMVTGRRAFEGQSHVSLIGNIMNAEPAALATLQPLTPPAFDRLVTKCLAKHPDNRWDGAHDVADELRWIARVASTGAGPPRLRPRAMTIAAAAAVALGLVALGAGLMWSLRAPTPSAQVARVSRTTVNVAPAERLQSQPLDVTLGELRPSQTAVALSPDGSLLVFSGVEGERQRLYLRPVDRLEATPIDDTEGGASPFFSPDGRWIGFWAKGALRRVAVTGGPSTTICPSDGLFGASWGEDDSIVFAPGTSTCLFRVPALGGTPRQATNFDERKGEISHRLPHVLPGASAVLFTAITHRLPDWNSAEIIAQSLATGARKTVTRAADARYLPSGHLLFVRAEAVVAAPFDVEQLEISGGAETVLGGVMLAQNTPNAGVEVGAAQLAVSATGSLVYAAGGAFRDQDRALLWVDRTGREDPLPLPSRAYLGPHLSPDGKEILVWTQGRERIVWTYHLVRKTMTRMTVDGRNSRAVWTPDGRRISFAVATAGPEEIVSMAADGSGARDLHGIRGQPSSWSPDGRHLAFLMSPNAAGDLGSDVWLYSLREGASRALLDSRFAEAYPEFSRDGRWIAYTSTETGRSEVYVQPFPVPGERRQLSNGGGTQPAWSHDGRELFYTETDERTQRTRMMSVPLQTGASLTAGAPRVLFVGTYRGQANTRGFDVSADGRRFLMVKPAERPPTRVTELVLVQNWLEELKAKVPAGRAK